MRTKKFAFVIVLLLIFQSFIFAQTPADRGFAEDEFRRGVQAFYRGSFNDAILQFEKALSYLPQEGLILEWLGKAYYRAGLEGAAIQQWEFASDTGYGGQLLQNTIEIVRGRRYFNNEFSPETRYVESTAFGALNDDTILFSQPIAILPLNDGGWWILAYGSNELIRLDVNGIIISRKRGPVNGFDRPMDLIKGPNDTLLVSEYAGDRISVLDSNGNYVKSFGSKGIGDGQFLGPQYLATDYHDNIFVTDYGNGRVVVFDSNGDFLFSFGKFKSPTGITIAESLVYVADSITGAIYVYDLSGNYVDILVPEGTFKNPEAMKLISDYLLVADTNRVLAVNLDSGSVSEIANTGNGIGKLSYAIEDVNGNIVALDIEASEIFVLSRMSELIGGLFVDIERVNADKFPQVTLEIKVENRRRQPIVGLDSSNFLVTEDKVPVMSQILTGSSNENTYGDITIILDRSSSMKKYETEVKQAVEEIAKAMNGKGTLRIIAAGRIPSTEVIANPTVVTSFMPSALKTTYSDIVSIDNAIRLAANELINGEHKRAIIFISDGLPTSTSFKNYTLADLSTYLNNNGISFATVSVSNNPTSAEVAYITENTPGEIYYVYRPEGISEVVKDLWEISSGIYTINYTSNLYTNFGRKFLPVEVEVYLYNRSGRAESGFFAPLQ